jgi:hypothetical protein
MPPKSNTVLLSPVQKRLSEVKAKYSPLRRASNKHNQMYEKGFPYGLMSLQLKKKQPIKMKMLISRTFLTIWTMIVPLQTNLGLLNLYTFVRESASSIAKTQASSRGDVQY